jgi:WhiB family redox-sensing transcriptional regulator
MPLLDLGWQDNAACLGMDLDWFFPLGNQGAHPEAQAACRACPVRAECLAFALTQPERHGHWGGMSAEERDKARIARRKHNAYAAAKRTAP